MPPVPGKFATNFPKVWYLRAKQESSRLPELARRGSAIRLDGTIGGPLPCVVLCRGLCHNPAIPAGVGPLLAVSLRHTQKAVNMPETRMNTASPCRFVSLDSLPHQATRRFDTEEVAGSNPVVPTISRF